MEHLLFGISAGVAAAQDNAGIRLQGDIPIWGVISAVGLFLVLWGMLRRDVGNHARWHDKHFTHQENQVIHQPSMSADLVKVEMRRIEEKVDATGRQFDAMSRQVDRRFDDFCERMEGMEKLIREGSGGHPRSHRTV